MKSATTGPANTGPKAWPRARNAAQRLKRLRAREVGGRSDDQDFGFADGEIAREIAIRGVFGRAGIKNVLQVVIEAELRNPERGSEDRRGKHGKRREWRTQCREADPFNAEADRAFARPGRGIW